MAIARMSSSTKRIFQPLRPSFHKKPFLTTAAPPDSASVDGGGAGACRAVGEWPDCTCGLGGRPMPGGAGDRLPPQSRESLRGPAEAHGIVSCSGSVHSQRKAAFRTETLGAGASRIFRRFRGSHARVDKKGRWAWSESCALVAYGLSCAVRRCSSAKRLCGASGTRSSSVNVSVESARGAPCGRAGWGIGAEGGGGQIARVARVELRLRVVR
eukprot:7380844-Prymnesium_polylepis.1